MSETLPITIESQDLAFNTLMDKFRHNGEWLTEHGAPLFEQFPGMYLAVSEGEVFVADEASEARRLAREKHPNDEPFLQYVPRESWERIYAY